MAAVTTKWIAVADHPAFDANVGYIALERGGVSFDREHATEFDSIAAADAAIAVRAVPAHWQVVPAADLRYPHPNRSCGAV